VFVKHNLQSQEQTKTAKSFICLAALHRLPISFSFVFDKHNLSGIAVRATAQQFVFFKRKRERCW